MNKFKKNKDLLAKYKNNADWHGVLSLYSGLYERKSNRNDYIINLVDTNPQLAVQCELNSTREDRNFNNRLKKKLIANTRSFANPKLFTENFIALIQILDTKDLLNVVKVKRKYVHRMIKIILNEKPNILWDLFIEFIQDKRHNQRLLWFIERLPSKSLSITNIAEERCFNFICEHLHSNKRYFHLKRLTKSVYKIDE
ncbi:hypothetical protein [Polaribacter sp. HaHaR_3_91]|uniref:hypothetical protein n=1 Tax=Polaribacter sp. HaHaR_3_91 TaxID=2745561 RepID=UPI001C4F12DB|nr:hypothetical protein [Polaribacter sp. HaHaR_3_91]QXP62753.1 hypothetical protein H0I27_12870 [Polaribacter sp. HaHaR_3_91]